MNETAVYLFQRFYREGEEEVLSFPELSDGFLPEPLTEGIGMTPISFYTEKVPSGIYRISLSFTAQKEIERLYVFTGRKQLRDILSLHKGEQFRADYVQSAAEIIPRYQDKVYPVEHLFFTICTDDPEAVQMGNCRAEKVLKTARVFLCGDSTVADHAGEIPYQPGAGYAAWGQALTAFFSKAAVENQAHCGLTTEDFREEGHFAVVQKYIQKGDICLFQFGHNDQKLAHLWPNGEYPINLRRFVEQVQEKEAFPVLVTPLGRNIWDSQENYLDLLKEHAQAVCKLAAMVNVPVIDLHCWSVEWIKKQGMKAARSYFHPGDYTHTNEYGAYLFAGFMAEELAKLFPKQLGAARKAKVFIPPDGLWEKLQTKNKGAENSSRKEEFDQMEKSTSGLVEIIEKARKDSGDGERIGSVENLQKFTETS